MAVLGLNRVLQAYLPVMRIRNGVGHGPSKDGILGTEWEKDTSQ